MKNVLSAAGAIILGMIGWQIARAYDSLSHSSKHNDSVEVAKPLLVRTRETAASSMSPQLRSSPQPPPTVTPNAEPRPSESSGVYAYTVGSDRDPAVMGKSELPAGSYSNYADGSGNSSQATLNKFCSRIHSGMTLGFMGSMSHRYDIPLQDLARNNGYKIRYFSLAADGDCRVRISVEGIENGRSYKFDKSCLVTSISVSANKEYVAEYFDAGDCI